MDPQNWRYVSTGHTVEEVVSWQDPTHPIRAMTGEFISHFQRAILPVSFALKIVTQPGPFKSLIGPGSRLRLETCTITAADASLAMRGRNSEMRCLARAPQSSARNMRLAMFSIV
jgi:hypothetical protein